MPPKEMQTGVYFQTHDGQRLMKLEDIPTIEFEDGEEELGYMLQCETSMEFTLSDEAMDALEGLSAPSKHLVEKIKKAFEEYFIEVSE